MSEIEELRAQLTETLRERDEASRVRFALQEDLAGEMLARDAAEARASAAEQERDDWKASFEKECRPHGYTMGIGPTLPTCVRCGDIDKAGMYARHLRDQLTTERDAALERATRAEERLEKLELALTADLWDHSEGMDKHDSREYLNGLIGRAIRAEAALEKALSIILGDSEAIAPVDVEWALALSAKGDRT